MEPVKARSSVPATGSAEAAAGTCMAAARSASAASQRRSTQRRPPRGPSPPPRPRAHALATGLVPAAALSSTLPRPTTLHHLPPGPSTHHHQTTSHHLPPPTNTYHHLPPPTTHKPPTTYHHLPPPATHSTTYHPLPTHRPPPTTPPTTSHRRPASDARPQSRWARGSTAVGCPASPRGTASIEGATSGGTRRARASNRLGVRHATLTPGPGTSPDPSLRPACARCVTATGHADRAGVMSTAAGTSANADRILTPTPTPTPTLTLTLTPTLTLRSPVVLSTSLAG